MAMAAAEDKSQDGIPIGSTLKRVKSPDDLEAMTYCLIDAGSFQVRSKDYIETKLKVTSVPSILDVYALDAFRSSSKATHIMQKLAFPKDLPEINRDPNDGGFYLPRLIVLNIMLPLYEPNNPIWGAVKEDGDSLHFVMYLAMNQQAYDDIRAESSEAHGLLKQWLQADPKSKADYELRGRLKAIPEILNADDLNLGMLRALVSNYNAKPFLTGPKYHSYVKTDNYLEIDVDIHRYIYAARSTFHGLLSEIPKMMLNFGVVVEGRASEELPEQMLAGVKMRVDEHTKAKSLDK